jgi:hypothetical protein
MSLEIGKAAGEGLAKNILHHVPSETESWLLKRGIEKVLLATRYEYPPNFWETVEEYASSSGFVIVQNHTSNADILAGDLLANRITQRVNKVVPEAKKMGGFIEPFASSLPENGQGEMSKFYLEVLPLINRLRVETDPTPTLNDILSGRIKTYKKFTDTHNKSTRRMREAAIEERKGIVLPAEATVQGGRINPATGEIFGMQVFTPKAIRQALRTVTITNENGILIPIGISAGYKVLNSETNGITLPATLVGFGASNKVIMTVHIGNPIIYKKGDIRNLDSEDLDYDIGTKIAQMLEPHERGVYSNREAFVVAITEYKNKQNKAEAILEALHQAA